MSRKLAVRPGHLRFRFDSALPNPPRAAAPRLKGPLEVDVGVFALAVPAPWRCYVAGVQNGPSELAIETPQQRLAARVWGPEDGAPVLAVHGWLDNANSFSALAPHLSGCRVVALDLPGHGRSEHAPPGAGYLFVDFVEAAFWALEALGWQRCALVGHSLGASVCAVLAGTFPDRIQSLVLLDGLGPLTETPEQTPARLERALVGQTKKGPNRKSPLYESREFVAGKLVKSFSRMSRPAVDVLLERGLEEVTGGVRWRSDPRLRDDSAVRLSEPQVLAFLTRIGCPALLVRAENGFTLDAARADARIDAFQNLSVFTVPGGHHVHLDDPDRVGPPVAAFLHDARQESP